MLRSFAIIILILGLLAPVSAKAGDKVIIFAAASLRDAVEKILIPFEAKTGIDIAVSYASSGVLARQISQGAPASIYLSANEKWADWIADKVQISKNKTYLANRLALISNSRLSTPIYLDGRLSDGLVNSKLAIGDTNHVPAGIYAKEALINMNLWPSVEHHIAQTVDVRAALFLVERGEAVAGITYLSDATVSKNIKIIDIFPEDSHPPILYKALMISENETPAAQQVYNKLLSPEVFNIYKEYGFDVSEIK